ncbi:hypothetical protein ARMGADRAFT_1089135 [Armillaria gallica]|uniref:Uncharacterized protein n=1 Tax=Armillaria gallica TaxID=47427 RepID=A0A2H3CKY2_ARMGA|nr:hypothetical protein ARMGADRAFT_1089135 [Armillaria gallica]
MNIRAWKYKYDASLLRYHKQDVLQKFFGFHETRSNGVFSPWGGPVIQIANSEFNLAQVVQACVEEEELLAGLDMYDPIDSQSLLSSPPSTPPTSHPPSPTPDISLTPAHVVTDAPPPPPPQARPSKSHSKEQSRQNHKRKQQNN